MLMVKILDTVVKTETMATMNMNMKMAMMKRMTSYHLSFLEIHVT